MLRRGAAVWAVAAMMVLMAGCAGRRTRPPGVYEVNGKEAVKALHQEMEGPVDGVLTMFGANWCGFCKDEAAYLRRERIPFRYFKVKSEADVARVYEVLHSKGVGLPPDTREGIPLTVNRLPQGTVAAIGFIGRTISGEDADVSHFRVGKQGRLKPLRDLLPRSGY